MIDDFSLPNIMKGCINSKDFKSPECKLLSRISDGSPVPEYPEYDPNKRYFYQMPGEDFERGPTDYFEFFSNYDFLQYLLESFGEYPSEVWDAEK